MNPPKDWQEILADHEKPVLAKKLHYYDIKDFKDKAIDPAALKSATRIAQTALLIYVFEGI